MGSVLTLLKGLGLGAATVGIALLAPWPVRTPIVGVLLGVAAGVYPGFSRECPPAEQAMQWVAAAWLATAGP